MPSSDYSNVVGGGLKLKGAGVEKSKKKKKKAKSANPDLEGAPARAEKESSALQTVLADEETKGRDETPQDEEVKKYGRTEAQRRFEERRKKRLEDRLKREGVQTHKERVQQLNKYLSTLSEHNDMPRIGPG